MINFKMVFCKNVITVIPMVIVLNFSTGYSQTPLISWGVWNLQSLHGKINFEGQYRSQKTILLSSLRQHPKNTVFNGELFLQSNSYLWHPNFMLLDLDLGFSPSTQRSDYAVAPDRSEVRTAEKIRVQTTFFSQRPLSINLFTNFHHTFINRDNLTNVESIRTDVGSNVIFPNKKLPLTFSYKYSNWSQKELQTGRKYLNMRHNLLAIANKSFGELDEHRFSISFDEYKRNFSLSQPIQNKVARIELKNDVAFDENHESSLNSMIGYHRQIGTIPFDRFQASELAYIKLPKNLKVWGNYMFLHFKQNALSSNQHSLRARLEHRIFLSVVSSVYYEYDNISQSDFNQFNNAYGWKIDYQKQIWKGRIALDYEYRKRKVDRKNQSLSVRIVNEEHVLRDAEIVLLNNPDVDINSVMITDETQSIIYQKDIDYILLERDSYLEIQRLPGGLIENGATVYVDYLSMQQISPSYASKNQLFGASLSLFGNFMELYYRSNELDFENLKEINFSSLKTISQKIYGVKFSFGFIKGGYELDKFDSNIIPYQSNRYYLTVAGNFFKKLNVSVTGNLRDFLFLDENEHQKFANLTGRILLYIGKNTNINIMGGYRIQEGRKVDLNLKTIRGELTTRWRQFILTLGVQAFYRDFVSEDVEFQHGYFRIEREF